MHILLTDISTCPRCGPEHGLILLVEEARERQVLEGALACANCREQYRIEHGVADLSLGENRAFGAALTEPAALRLVALAGVTSGRARLLLAGPVAAHGAAAAALLPEVQIVAAAERGAAAGAVEPELSRISIAAALPFYGKRFAGVVLSGGAVELVAEGARVLGPTGRLVVEPADDATVAAVERAGLAVLAREGATLVAARR